MPIIIGDLITSISVSNIETALGRASTFKITFTNTSSYPGYNLYCKLTLPDGVSFDSASILYSNKTFDNSNNELIEFINIKDLYSNESYSFDITVIINDKYRSNGTNVPFNTTISNLNILSILDSTPRGNIDSGNVKITSTLTTTATGFRFYIKFIFPPVSLKGAGANLSDTPTNPFDIKASLLNNTRLSSSIDSLMIEFANGIRYIGTNYSVVGPDANELLNPLIIPAGNGINYDSLKLSNFSLSAGSTNEISFQGAIWNKFALNGVVNSGDTIINNTSLSNIATLSGENEIRFALEKVIALELLIEKFCNNVITDVNVTNIFTLNYKLGEYIGLNGILITDILSDGLTFIVDDNFTGNLFINSDGSTTITWDLGSLSTNYSDSIIYNTTTNLQYSTDIYLAAGDVLSNSCTISWIDSNTGESSFLTSTNYLSIIIPTITKNLDGYYDKNKNLLSSENATKGDYIGFTLIYDASSIIAVQNNVNIFDYAPLSMELIGPPEDLTYSDSSFNSIIPVTVDYNGLLWAFGNLPSNSTFSISFKLLVTKFSSAFDINLGKLFISNNNNNVFSNRSSVSIALSLPNPEITNTVIPTTIPITNAIFHSVYNFTITITNNDITNEGYPTCNMYNSTVTITLPTELSFYSPTGGDSTPTFNTFNATATNGSITSETTYSLFITQLNTDGSVIINFKGIISSLPIANKSYTIIASMTRGTTSESQPYDFFPGNNLEANSSIKAIDISLSKSLTPNNISLMNNYSTEITLTVPEGVIAYNLYLNNEYIANNNSLLTNILLNDSEPPYGYSTDNNILSLLISNYVDSSASSNSFILTFDDVATNFTIPNQSTETRNLSSTGIWGYSSSNYNSSSVTLSQPLIINAPKLSVELLQSNITQNYNYTTDILKGTRLDTILYKYVITNIGYSTAYNIFISDILPSNIEFITFNNITGNYDQNTKTLSWQINSLTTNDSIDIIFTTKIQRTAPLIGDIASNILSFSYYSLPSDGYYFSDNSNIVKLINSPLLLEKSQKNISISPDFVKSTLSIIKEQSIDYKITITNLTSYTLTNNIVTDFFPSLLTFVSFQPFSNGTLSLNSNIVTATINSIAPNEVVNFIYTVKMNVDVLQSNTTFSSIDYSINNGSNNLINHSNNLVTNLYGTGRGYTIY